MTTRRSFDEGNARQGVPDSFLRSDPLFGEGYRLGAEELKPVERKGEAMTSEDELKAAAERWGRKCVRSTTYPEEETMYEIPRQRLLDAERLADWAVARLAAAEQREREDAEPITECWLESLGWLWWDDRDDVYSGELYCKIGEWLGWETRLTFHLGSIEAVRMCDPDEVDGLSAECVTLLGNPCSKSNRPTRGQLRKLLEAMKGET